MLCRGSLRAAAKLCSCLVSWVVATRAGGVVDFCEGVASEAGAMKRRAKHMLRLDRTCCMWVSPTGWENTVGFGQEKQLMTNEEAKQKALQTLSP